MIGRCFGEKRISSGGIRSIADIPELYAIGLTERDE